MSTLLHRRVHRKEAGERQRRGHVGRDGHAGVAASEQDYHREDAEQNQRDERGSQRGGHLGAGIDMRCRLPLRGRHR
jgi:hypothetical protein